LDIVDRNGEADSGILPGSLAMAVFMPISRARLSSKGPPELPWFKAASIWMIDFIILAFRDGSERFKLEMMPDGHGALETERVADRKHLLANPQIVRIAELAPDRACRRAHRSSGPRYRTPDRHPSDSPGTFRR
jgi:hypothetical protein